MVDEFTYVSPPALTAISPAVGSPVGGTGVTITGTGFTEATDVNFGQALASTLVVNSAGTQITAMSPTESAGTVDVTVTGPGGTSATSAADKFTFLGVTGVSSSEAPGIYNVGAVIPIQVTFSEPVTVTGVPQLDLNAGISVAAAYTSGSGTSTLAFTYRVAAGQTTGDLDYASTAALALDGGTIADAAGNAASLALREPGGDALATQDIAVAAVSDGFESGGFTALPWQLSSSGDSPANWTVQSSVVHSGSFAAESGTIGASSSSTLSVSLTEPAGEFAFWRAVSSAAGSGILTFEIDGTPVGQWSGSVPWQQAFFWVAAGTHTYSWVYAKDADTPAGSDAAWLDDVQFLPGTTLVVEGTSAADDQFSFDASGTPLVVTLDGASQSFTTREFNKFVLLGEDGSASAALPAARAETRLGFMPTVAGNSIMERWAIRCS